MPENTETVMDTVNPIRVEDDTALPAESTTHRPRKKHIYDQLLKQLEFYLGDANLSKDRFLSQKLLECPQISVALFLTFNKIRNITTDVQDLVIALKKSNWLELTEDETKVFRKTKVQKRENQDECTIYVENLPAEANHDWLTKIFINYGNVLYVSIPKFRDSKQNKGFAFVEFDSPDCVAKVLEAFGAVGCRLSANMPSDQLLSIKTFENDEGKSLYQDKDENTDNIAKDTSTKLSSSDVKEGENKSLGKRKRLSTDQECEIDEAKKLKPAELSASVTEIKVVEVIEPKQMTTNTKEEPAVQETSKAADSMEITKSEENLEQTSCLESIQMPQEGGSDHEHDSSDDEAAGGDKNLPPKSRKNKKSNMKNRLEVSSLGLQVLSKKEWKRLRNKYLNLQRDKMAALKKQARKLALEEHQRKIEEQHKKEQKDNSIQSNGKEAHDYTFTPGVIIKYEPDGYIEDLKQFKLNTKSVQGVVYVDITLECKDVFIRCDSAEIAASLVAAKTWPNCSLLQGNEECAYWKKIEDDRREKFNKKREKERGRNKLLQRIKKLGVDQSCNDSDSNKAAASTGRPSISSAGPKQHIRFDDDADGEATADKPETAVDLSTKSTAADLTTEDTVSETTSTTKQE